MLKEVHSYLLYINFYLDYIMRIYDEEGITIGTWCVKKISYKGSNKE